MLSVSALINLCRRNGNGAKRYLRFVPRRMSGFSNSFGIVERPHERPRFSDVGEFLGFGDNGGGMAVGGKSRLLRCISRGSRIVRKFGVPSSAKRSGPQLSRNQTPKLRR